MRAIEFPEANTIFAKNQPQYLQLPAHRSNDGTVTTCYKLTWRERVAILFGGELWLQLLTFNKPLQAQRITIEKPPL